jgi:hypothetical protein
MKNLLILIFLLCLIGCKEKSEVQKEFEQAVKSEHSIDCIDVGSLYRCENHEVICYYNSYGESMALQCKFKGDK